MILNIIENKYETDLRGSLMIPKYKYKGKNKFRVYQ